MLRSLTILAAAAALASALAHALRAQPGGLDGAVQPHAVQVVVSGPDAVSTVRYESDPAGGTTVGRDCRRGADAGAVHVDPLAPMLRS